MSSARRLPVRAGVLAVVAAAVVGLLPGAGAASAVEDGGLGVRLVDAPEDRRDDPRARVYVIDHLAPGATISRRIEVTNQSDRPMQVRLYPGPAEVVDGTWSPLEPGATSDLTEWTSVGQERASLAPGGSVVVPVTIEIPRDASAGERYGVVWAETASTDDGQVQTVSRVGIRVYLSVGPGGEPASDFRIDTLTGARLDDGTLRVLAEVVNTGGRALDLEGQLQLGDGPGGLSAGPYPTTGQTTLAPGDTGEVLVDLVADLPLGPWQAELTLTSGQLERTATAELTFPEQGVGETADAEQVQDGRPWWWYAGLGLLLLVLAAGAAWAVRRRRTTS